MFTKFEINGNNYQFGSPYEGEIRVIQINTTSFPIAIQVEQIPLVKAYLKNLVHQMSDDGYVIYNGSLTYKQDINTNL